MPKKVVSKTIFVCDACGAEYPRWQGQCSQCNAWNSLVESVAAPAAARGSSQNAFYGASGGEVVTAAAVARDAGAAEDQRFSTLFYELDRVFGGGIVFGSVVLVGGEPGIGKSTILTQMLINILKNQSEKTALYVAGEESPRQINTRIQRMEDENANTDVGWKDRLSFFTGTDVDAIIAAAEREKPGLLVVDSIQTLATSELTGMAGAVGQLRECTARLVAFAKRTHTPTFLVGHVTKEGDIAGPKVLEHIVDTVVQISGSRNDEIRIVRALKNRFGPTDEVGLFRLTTGGAQEVKNPNEVFLEEKSIGQPGSALALCLEGSRPIVIEVQALVVSSQLPTPRRVSRGINVSKLHLLLAVLQKYSKARLADADVYVNVVGSIETNDPAIDLAVAVAILSSSSGKPPGKDTVYCGEIGLLGEVRKVLAREKREKEAKRLGYTRVEHAGTVANIRALAESLGK